MSFQILHSQHLFDNKYPHLKSMSGMGGGFLDDVFDFGLDGVNGLLDAIEGSLQSVIKVIEHIGETIALIVRAAFGDVSWDEVLNEMGKIFQDVGAVFIYLNPITMSYNWFSQSRLTAHAFNELDKFSGGMLTSGANVSSLVFRAMRGDPISKAELVGDLVFIIKVGLLVVTAGAAGVWVAAGGFVGAAIGREVCKHQTEAVQACQVTFAILGAALGGWAEALSNATAEETAFLAGDAAYEDFLREQAAQGFTAAEESAWLAGDQAYATYLNSAAGSGSTSLLAHLADASSELLNKIGYDMITQEAIKKCKQGQWVGGHECELLGRIAGKYLKAPEGTDWAEFLGREAVMIGAEELLLQWFPPASNEFQSIQQWQIKYVDVPVEQRRVIVSGFNPKILLVGAAMAAALVGAS